MPELFSNTVEACVTPQRLNRLHLPKVDVDKKSGRNDRPYSRNSKKPSPCFTPPDPRFEEFEYRLLIALQALQKAIQHEGSGEGFQSFLHRHPSPDE